MDHISEVTNYLLNGQDNIELIDCNSLKARLRLADDVDKDDIEEAIRLIEMSRASLSDDVKKSE